MKKNDKHGCIMHQFAIKFCFIFFSCFPYFLLHAQTWDGSVNTSWNEPGNWSTNTVPISSSDVTIPNTTNKPVLDNDVTIHKFYMSSGSELDFNGYKLSNTSDIDINGATLNNSNASTDIVISSNSSSDLRYFRTNTVNDNITFNISGGGDFYESNAGANSFNGNTTFNIAGNGKFQMGDNTSTASNASAYNGNVTINRTVGGTSYIFKNGFTALTGDFSYTNHSGGELRINFDHLATATIDGQVNIVSDGGGYPYTVIKGLKNTTPGGSVYVEDCGAFNAAFNELNVKSFTVNRFWSVGSDYIFYSTINGDLNVTDGSSNGAIFYLKGNTINGNTTLTQNSNAEWRDADVDPDIYNGDLTLIRNSGGSFHMAYGRPITINGNLTINSSANVTFTDYVHFGGSSNSTFEQQGTQSITIPKMQMEKTGFTSLTLNDPLTISTDLIFNSGVIYSSTSNYLQLSDNATSSGASVGSHVVGVVKKKGNDNFVFPIGTDYTINTVEMSAPADINDVFSAEYIYENPDSDGYDTSQYTSPIKKISHCEYWKVNREVGTSNVTLSFSYQAPCAGNSGYINDYADIHIVHWNGTDWDDLGNGGGSGGMTGTVQTNGVVSSFSPFTFGSTNLMSSPLPLSIVQFEAVQQHDFVALHWKTVEETNLENYEIERSYNGSDFTSLFSVHPLNTEEVHEYNVIDKYPFSGTTYYRLKVYDYNGRISYSNIAAVRISDLAGITIFPNPASDVFHVNSDNVLIKIDIYDMEGRLAKSLSPNTDNSYSVQSLPKGLYTICAISDRGLKNALILVQ